MSSDTPEEHNGQTCDHCHQRPAQVIIKIVDGGSGEIRELHLCRECAAEMQKNPLNADPQLSKLFEEIMKNAGVDFSKFFSQQLDHGDAEANSAEKAAPRCPVCHHSLADVIENKMLFCPDCLKAFREQIFSQFFGKYPMHSLQRNAPVTTPTGIPVGMDETMRQQDNLKMLQKLRDSAVADERYKEAARYQKIIQKKNSEITKELKQIYHLSEKTAISDDFVKACQNFHAENLECPDPSRPQWLPQTFSLILGPLIRLRSYAILYRNIAGKTIPPSAATPKAAEDIRKTILDVIQEEEFKPVFGADAALIIPQKCTLQQKLQMNASGFGTMEFLNKKYATAILHSKNHKAILNINRLDHLQVALWGEYYNFLDTIELSMEIGRRLAEHLPFETCEYGYFSRNLCALGNGYSIGRYLHLPALTFDGHFRALQAACERYGVDLSPLYSPDKAGLAPAIYRLKSACSLGIPFMQQAFMINMVTQKLEFREVDCRKKILSTPSKRSRLLDTLGRIAGIIKGAREMDLTEARYMLSMMWFGVELGCFKYVEHQKILSTYAKLVLPPAASAGESEQRHAERMLRYRQAIARLLRHDFGYDESIE